MDKKILIWLDDLRNPFDNGMAWAKLFSPVKIDSTLEVIWLKNYTELKEWIEEHGIPYAICFDHDLGDFVNVDILPPLKCVGFLGNFSVKDIDNYQWAFNHKEVIQKLKPNKFQVLLMKIIYIIH